MGNDTDNKTMLHFCNVIHTVDGQIEHVYLFYGNEHKVVADAAEDKFLDLLHEHLSNFDEYTPDDLEAVLEDGYEENNTDKFFIFWPYEKKV